MSKNTPTRNNIINRQLTVAVVIVLIALQFGLLLKINNDNKAILKNQSIQGLRLLNLDTNDPDLDSPIN
ncbi:MAG: hypothetical protein NTV95_03175 [Candidatus Saccharibacteria bacterium]|nr:hypothetical protein [Candidatus Saccharibacteria bacterium]